MEPSVVSFPPRLQGQVFVAKPRPGVLESHGYEELLKSFGREMKETPSPEASNKVGRVILEQVERFDRFRRDAQTNSALRQELIEAGYLPHPKQLELMGVTPEQLTTLEMGTEVEMRRRGFFYLQALTHPAIVQARILLQDRGYSPLQGKKVDIFEDALLQRKAYTYEDFGLQPVAPKPDDGVQESSSKILAQGLFSWISKNHVGFPTMSNSMPSTNSAEALASLALLGTFAFIPTDGQLSGLDARLKLLERTKEALFQHPVVLHHKHQEHVLSNERTLQEELRSRSEFIGVTLKQNPATILEEAKTFYDRGVRVFRVYDAGSTNQLYQAVQILKEPSSGLPGITVLAGQVTSAEQARILVLCGADGVIVGIGEGGICTTPVVGSLAPNNILVAYELCKAGLGVPVICDGGVGRAAGVIFAMGASGSMASRRIIGGTLEHSPVLYWVKRNGHLEKQYAGEASGVIKILGGNVTMVGDPYNMEGISSWVQQNVEYPTIPALYAALLAGFAKVVRFNRAHSLMDLQQRPVVENIKMFSDGARVSAGAHHTQSEVPLSLYGNEVSEYF